MSSLHIALKSEPFRTRKIKVGSLLLGGDESVVIQSMTTSDTMDVEATIREAVELAEAGCQMLRITAPTINDAMALEKIKAGLLKRGINIPLVADIHFLPKAADIAADFVEKIRINPGNFADRKMFKSREYTDAEYAEEIERIKEKFSPLVLKLKRLDRALRIGTNHGSLSDRIMNRYGDTPEGMVESAFEYAEVCRENGFHNFCFSMKASNVRVMVAAYRLLVDRQRERGWDYPIHLGVTEAGEGEDARVKSAIGIGSLLAEGIGDTIRVSLTEDSIHEIPVAKSLAGFFPRAEAAVERSYPEIKNEDPSISPLVWQFVDDETEWVKELQADKLRPDVIVLKEKSNLDLRDRREHLRRLSQNPKLLVAVDASGKWSSTDREEADFILREGDLSDDSKERLLVDGIKQLKCLSQIDASRSVLHWRLNEQNSLEKIIESSFQLGTPLLDIGVGGVSVSGVNSAESLKLAFNILQATRRRMSKTEYIACPSCGRTLFNLQETTARIKAITSHLKDVKIAIMGCIVNGPGEMADADFGYVGGAPGRVNLYVAKDCVERNIPSAEAPQRLVELIKKHNKWHEPAEEQAMASNS